MRRIAPVVGLLAAAAVGCAQAPPPPSSAEVAGAQAAISAASRAAPGGARGSYVMRVRGTGRADGNTYLNSETDYRDQTNLTIALTPASLAGLKARYGDPPERALQGRMVRVDGVARRVRVEFLANGRPTGKYYFQTHVDVAAADQLTLFDDAR